MANLMMWRARRPASAALAVSALCTVYAMAFAPAAAAQDSTPATAPAAATDPLARCLMQEVLRAPATETVSGLRLRCAELFNDSEAAELTEREEVLISQPDNGSPSAAIDDNIDTRAGTRRARLEAVADANPFSITAHRPNYILPFAYHDSPNLESTNGNDLEQRLETKFQLSFKFPIARGMFWNRGDLYFAYTNQSYWQVFDDGQSRPFRETNHSPELFVEFDVNWDLLGTTLDYAQIGVIHQSNGQDLPTSRSWNRVFAELGWKYDDLFVSVRPWLRIPDPPKETPDDPKGDDNPNIERWAGQFESVVAWKRGRDTYSAVWRNNLRADNRGSIQLNWSFPLSERARGYVQYFNGYAESLIDYQDTHQRLGFGILLTDWL